MAPLRSLSDTVTGSTMLSKEPSENSQVAQYWAHSAIDRKKEKAAHGRK